MRVLIVEDETRLADALVQILLKNKITADACYNGIDGLDNALSGIYDVIVLDIMLPGMNGIDVLKSIRREGLNVPVLMFTAKDDISDKVRGLDLKRERLSCRISNPMFIGRASMKALSGGSA